MTSSDVQDAKTLAYLEALAKMVPTETTVRRDGRKQRVHSEELVPGDVVSLGHLVRQPLEIRVQGTSKFLGRLMVHEGLTAVRVDRNAVAMRSEA